MNVQVTENDIAEGKRYSCYRCPIALAVHRACERAGWHDIPEIIVTLTHASCGEHGAFLPSAAQRFIADFDRRDKVRPFNFELPLV